jgi:hypothetical protein
MNTDYHIHYLKRQEIDTARWDQCIHEAPNGLIYGFHYYLDHMAAGQWDALVLDDYAAVMPLTWRRKAGIRFLYQPAFTQQTGIFSREALPPDVIQAFLAATARHFRFAEIFLNHGNPLPSLRPQVNYILRLDAPYDQLAARYKKDLAYNLRRAARWDLCYSPWPGPGDLLETFRNLYSHRITSISPADYQRFEQLCIYLRKQQQLILRVVTSNELGLLATGLLLSDHKRLYLLQSSTLPKGRDVEANHFLLDQLIREFAGSGMVLDFEGSDIPGIAHFYANFGSTQQPYFFYRHNLLPWPVRLLKR